MTGRIVNEHDLSAAVATSRSFVEAVAWGEHITVWELLAPEGRKAVLRIALERGMDDTLAMRLREGTESTIEREEFLADLVNGLRADLSGTDLDAVRYELDGDSAEPGLARVIMNVELPEILGSAIPAGFIELSRHGEVWLVECLIPRRSG